MARLKKDIPGFCLDEWITQTPSQFYQDVFVLAMLQGKTNGTFLDIGAGHPYFMSNTYLLEKQFNWSGICIDCVDETQNSQSQNGIWQSFYQAVRDPSWPESVNNIKDLPESLQKECINIHGYSYNVEQYFKPWTEVRPKSQFILADAATVDYSQLGDSFDFLQIDLDHTEASLSSLTKSLHSNKFAVIAFEHDIGHPRDDRNYLKNKSQEIIQSHGYEMVINNVTVPKQISIDNPFFNHHIEDWYVNPNIVSRDIINLYKWIDFSNEPKFPLNILCR